MRFPLSAALVVILAVRASGADSPFYSPIRSNDRAAVEKLVHSAGVDARDGRGTTPLMYAAALGSFDVLQLLVAAGAQVNAANDFGATPLMWCAGDAAKARYLIGKGASVMARSKLGRTPLIIAAMYDGSEEIVRLMIERGADVKAKDENGSTALASAAAVNNVAAAKLLLARGADPNTADGGNYTPLLLAAGNGDRSGAMVKLLLEYGARVNAVSGDAFELVKNGKLRIGRLTSLMLAAGLASFESVEALVKAGADVTARDVRGMTALSIAIATDRADPRIVRLLLEKGTDPKIRSDDGETAADWARKYRNPTVLKALGIPAGELPIARTEKRDALSVPAAIEAGVAVLQRTSAEFLGKGGCLGCHAQHTTGMAVAAARERGVKVDAALEAAQAGLTASLRGGLEQSLYQVLDPPSGVDSQQFSLIQMSGSRIQPGLSTDALVFHIAAMQRKEGDWPNYGVVRPPLEDGGFQHTAKGIRALRLYPIPGRKAEFDQRVARAAAWLERSAPVATEDRTMQILGIRWAGKTPPKRRVAELAALQRSSGGWGQTENLPEDAYASGEALYALREAGMPADDSVFRKGVDYLLRTQLADGSWLVRTRAAIFQPYFESGFPHGHDQWISSAGTAFATIALSLAK